MPTQRGELADLQTLAEQNAAIWTMNCEGGRSDEGDFEIRYTPLELRRTPAFLWLGYYGNVSEQIYDLATREYQQRDLGGAQEVRNRDRTLLGLVRHLVCPQE